MKTLIHSAIVVLLLFAASCSDEPSSYTPHDDNTPSFSKGDGEGDIDIRDRYIVVFKQSVRNPHVLTDELIRAHGGTVHYRYQHALKGFAATLPEQALEGIRRNPNVEYIEPDGIVSINTTQSPATWGLDRIDQHYLPLDNSYTYNNDGTDVTVYIIDTGIRITHNEFGGRASHGWDYIDNDADASDCNGHGTHVAGTVGGSTYGVAKNCNLIAVRVLNCSGSGSYAQVIAGVDWVTGHHTGSNTAVANMSLGGSNLQALNDAVTNSIADGVVYAVAAGNSNANACNYSPASTPNALTVGATTSSDSRASYSNYGSCLDIFAPGSSITSAWYSSNTATNTIGGTSMASPHVAGVAALYLDANPTATPAQVETAIESAATSGVVSGPGSGSPNLLLYSLIGAPPPPSTPIHGSISGSSSSQGGRWTATATIVVHDASHATVAGANVTITWSGGASGTSNGTTNASGSVTLSKSNIKNNKTSVTATITNITKAGCTYTPSSNDPGSVVIYKP